MVDKPSIWDEITEKITRSDQACQKSHIGRATGKTGVEKYKGGRRASNFILKE